MAAQAAAQLLDELMGRDRNLAPTEKKKEIRWEDSQVCKHFLVKFCPNELFVNTRADLGLCEKIHDEGLKKEYEKSSGYQKMGYEEDFLRFCQSMLSDVERRIRRGRQRLAQGSQEASAPTPIQVHNNEEQIPMLSERINGLLEQVEKLGCEGKVEEAQGIMKLCDQLKDEREGLRRANENSHWMQTAEIAAAQEKQMEVCEVCGAFLIVGDAQQRVDDHLMGKQHMGYAKIKATVDEILNKREKEREERELKRDKERDERRKQREEEEKLREKERTDRRKKIEDDRKREREKERERDRKRRRSRSRSRDRRRSRSKSHNRKQQRSGSRERSRRERKKSHSRSRSPERVKKARKSRSRSRSRRSRSRDKHSKSKDKGRGKDRKSKEREEKSRKHREDDKKSEDRDYEMDNGKNEKLNDEGTGDSNMVDKMDDAAPKDGKLAWQTCGWSEVTTAIEPIFNGAKSEGDSEQ